jgi:hypothetical protein
MFTFLCESSLNAELAYIMEFLFALNTDVINIP